MARKKYKILCIDDDPTVMEDLELSRIESNFEIDHFTNLEEGMEGLKSHKYQGLILDGSANITPDDSEDTRSFLFQALREKSALEENQNRYIPTIVFTGYIEDFKPMFSDPDLDFFSKTADYDDMFKCLKSKIDKSEDTKIIRKHRKIFDLFEYGYLDDTYRENLLQLCKNQTITTTDYLITTFKPQLRNGLELIIKKMHEYDSSLPNPRQGFAKFMNHLEGYPKYVDNIPQPTRQPVVNDKYITRLMKALYSINSQVSNHFNEEHVDKYTFKFLLNGLLAVFLWYGKWVKKHIEENDPNNA